jgi:hypothetical protein
MSTAYRIRIRCIAAAILARIAADEHHTYWRVNKC